MEKLGTKTVSWIIENLDLEEILPSDEIQALYQSLSAYPENALFSSVCINFSWRQLCALAAALFDFEREQVYDV